MSRWADGLEQRAKALLPEAVFTYLRQGAGSGVSAAEAADAWRGLRFAPRVLRDVSTVDLSTTLLGTPVRLPVGIAPTTLQRQAHPGGEVAMGLGAAAAGALMCVSSNAGFPFARIAAAGGPWWVQAYVLRDRGLTRAMLARAVDAGAKAVVLTADTPLVGTKEEGDVSVWDVVPDEHLHANEDLAGVPHTAVEKAMDLTPDAIGWLGEVTGLPVVVKGVLRPDDARTAVSAGAAAIWVSNHGGRQLDRVVATASALGGVVAAVGGDAEVYVDGGIRHGLDVLAALALGARGAFVARPTLWALCVSGSDGVTKLLDGFATELGEAMQLAGVSRLRDAATAGLLAL